MFVPLAEMESININELPFSRRALLAFGDQVFLELPEPYQKATDVKFRFKSTSENFNQAEVSGYVEGKKFVISLWAKVNPY